MFEPYVLLSKDFSYAPNGRSSHLWNGTLIQPHSFNARKLNSQTDPNNIYVSMYIYVCIYIYM